MPKTIEQIDAVTLNYALINAAQDVLFSSRLEPRPDSFMRNLGDYMICCAIASDGGTMLDLGMVFGEGIVVAGGGEDDIRFLFGAALHHRRTIFSLAYIAPDAEVPGIVRTRRSVEIREADFIRGIANKARPRYN